MGGNLRISEAKGGLHWMGWGQGLDNAAETDTRQNRVSFRQCQAVTSKRTACKPPNKHCMYYQWARSHTPGNTA